MEAHAEDAAQRAAIQTQEGHVLVVAGPGSGKTRVLGERLRWLIEEKGAAPESILALTFTNRAAAELRERLGLRPRHSGPVSDSGRGHAEPFVGTFHGFCLRFLKREERHIPELPTKFSLLGSASQRRLMRAVLKDHDFDLKHYPAGDTLDRIQRVRLAEALGDQGPALGDLIPLKAAYETKLRASGALDFDTLLIRTLQALRYIPAVRDRAQSGFTHVLVDEAQDTSPIQWEILRALTGTAMTLFAVGDPDQSIYAWRGADSRGLHAFDDRFSDTAQYHLNRNYRSSAVIVEASDALIGFNEERLPRRLEAARDRGESVLSLSADSAFAEARAISAIARNLKADGMPWDEIAVLVRTGAQMRLLEACFTKDKVPYRVHGGVPFFERREIQDVLAYLRLIHNPRDQDAFWRAIEAPKRGVGPVHKKLLQEAVDEMNGGVFWKDQVTFPAAIQSSRFCARFQARTQTGLLELGAFLESLVPLSAEPAHVALDRVIEALLETPWLDAMPSTEGSGDRRDHLEALQQHAVSFHRRYPGDGIAGFLSEIALITRRDEPPAEGDDGAPRAPALTLSTIHAAKGTEFDVVFVAGLEEGLLPHGRALWDGARAPFPSDVDEEQGGHPGESTEGLEEERRLFFVAMTRARNQLILTWSHTRHVSGIKRPEAPSRFLEELPADLVTRLDPDQLDVLATLKKTSDTGFSQGDRVEHSHYGQGTVVGFLSRDADARILIAFDTFGAQELFLAYTSLRRLR